MIVLDLELNKENLTAIMKEIDSINFKSAIFRLNYLLGVHYVEIPKKVMSLFFGKRIICYLNDRISFQCGIVSLGNGKGYITVNNKRLTQLGLAFGDSVLIKLEIDSSEYGMEVPIELIELLQQDEIGNERFGQQTKGMQRYIIYYISQVKSSQKRIDRALFLIENLKKLSPGKETFRELLGKDKI